MVHFIDVAGSKDADLVFPERYSYVKKGVEFPDKFLSLTAQNTKFIPLNLEDKPSVANLPTGFKRNQNYDELWLFRQFFDDTVLDILVDCTNKNAYKSITKAQMEKPGIRIRRFEPVIKEEILSWMGIMLWMSLFPVPRLEWYWNEKKRFAPIHAPVMESMPYARWRAIGSYFHCNPTQFIPPEPGTPVKDGSPWYRPHQKVSTIANLIRAKCLQLFTPGTHVAIDECIAGFTGRSGDTVTIKTKPTPEGYKIWCAASEGYCHDFLFHVPSQQKGAGPQGLQIEQWKQEIIPPMPPTNLVVLELATRLHDKGMGHCIWMDNLFTTQQLLSELRKRGIGGAGTVRTGGNKTKREIAWDKERAAELKAQDMPQAKAPVAKRSKSKRKATKKKPKVTLPIAAINSATVLDSQATLVATQEVSQEASTQERLITAVAELEDDDAGITPSDEVDPQAANGLHPLLQELKLRWQNRLIWGAFFAAIGSDSTVLQFAWKDSAVVLFMTTVTLAAAVVSAIRKKPSSLPAYQVTAWKGCFECEQDIPEAINLYNHHLNGVDVADQRRAAYHYHRRCYKTWHPLFHWLREMVLVNCTILWTKSGKLSGTRDDVSTAYRRELALSLMEFTLNQNYIERPSIPKRKRELREDPLAEAPCDIPACPNSPQHMKKRNYCAACAVIGRKSGGGSNRKPLGELSMNSLQGRRVEDKESRKRPRRSTYGCPICNLTLCRDAECWRDHRIKLAN